MGSLLTPLIALRFGTHTAIVVVALPRMVGSLLRWWRLRHSVDRSVLVYFGIFRVLGILSRHIILYCCNFYLFLTS
ncbi:MAG: hypothetical protein ACLP29_08030 [Dissulfurispiraceae bacterium]